MTDLRSTVVRKMPDREILSALPADLLCSPSQSISPLSLSVSHSSNGFYMVVNLFASTCLTRFVSLSRSSFMPSIKTDVSHLGNYLDNGRVKLVPLPTARFHLLGMSDELSNVIVFLHTRPDFPLNSTSQCCRKLSLGLSDLFQKLLRVVGTHKLLRIFREFSSSLFVKIAIFGSFSVDFGQLCI